MVDRSRIREFTVFDWDLCRNIPSTRADLPNNLEEWCDGIRKDTTNATKKVKLDLNVEKIGSILGHLLEPTETLFRRWKEQKHNRTLQKNISTLNKEIEKHCNTLCEQQWNELCESVNGKIRNGKSWKLLKHLLDEHKH
ncbi:hypothetical protein HPB49_000833 [Dermacentor silvarum]|uniref:Uncharacterized protein n=1 Tax=Dermacentor silvarum TaxID=543639 RepID=A0ACB8DID5_DERSI|nr:hypothetical protein HPB49_000833 [Dermacentor silvarum]